MKNRLTGFQVLPEEPARLPETTGRSGPHRSSPLLLLTPDLRDKSRRIQEPVPPGSPAENGNGGPTVVSQPFPRPRLQEARSTWMKRTRHRCEEEAKSKNGAEDGGSSEAGHRPSPFLSPRLTPRQLGLGWVEVGAAGESTAEGWGREVLARRGMAPWWLKPRSCLRVIPAQRLPASESCG